VVCGVEISSGSKLIKAGEVQRHFVSTSHYMCVYIYIYTHISFSIMEAIFYLFSATIAIHLILKQFRVATE